MGVCDGCGAEVSDEELYRCGECGKAYCEECAVADGVIKTLGVCSDCEETYEAEEDTGAGSNRKTMVQISHQRSARTKRR